MVLLTDGANTAGNVQPYKAAELAAQQGLRIHTIGVGGEPRVVRGVFGTQVYNSAADLDEETQVTARVGQARLTASDQMVRLKSGERSVAKAGEPPSPPLPAEKNLLVINRVVFME